MEYVHFLRQKTTKLLQIPPLPYFLKNEMQNLQTGAEILPVFKSHLKNIQIVYLKSKEICLQPEYCNKHTNKR